MIWLDCPWCGARAQTEFTYGGDAARTRPGNDNPSADTWYAYVYERENPRGVHQELWHHTQGCRRWHLVTRDTATHAVTAISDASGRPAS